MNLFFAFIFLFTLASSTLVIFSRHPIHSVLSLILVFCLASMSIILITVDFFGLLLVIVYVGAIAVLFLFVIMMLNIKVTQVTESVVRWVPLVLALMLALVSELAYSLDPVFFNYFSNSSYPWESTLFGGANVKLLGEGLYTHTFFSFAVAGLILLTALLGAILLTVGIRRSSRRQQVYKQVGRSEFSAVYFYK